MSARIINIWLVAGLGLLWTAGSWWWYSCNMKGVCPSSMDPLQHGQALTSTPLWQNLHSWKTDAVQSLDKILDVSRYHENPALQKRYPEAVFVMEDLSKTPQDQGTVRDYLVSLAAWLQQNPAAYAKITSYTLDEPMRYDNMLQGIEVADTLKDYLVKLGVDKNTVHVSSMPAKSTGDRSQTIAIVPSNLPYNPEE